MSQLEVATINSPSGSDLVLKTGATSRAVLYNNGDISLDGDRLFIQHSTGNVGINSSSVTATMFRVSGNIGGAGSGYGLYLDGYCDATNTSSAQGFVSRMTTGNGAFSIPNLYHFIANPGTFGTGNVVVQQGFVASSSLTAGANNYGFVGSIAQAPVMVGATALRASNIVTVTYPNHGLKIGSNFRIIGASDRTFDGRFVVLASPAPTANSFSYAQTGSNVGGVINVGIYPDTRWNVYMSGSASNYFAGNTLIGHYVEGFVETAAMSGSKTSTSPNLQVLGNILCHSASATNGYGGGILFTKWASGTVLNSKTPIQNGENLGFISWSGADGDTQVEGAYIKAVVNGTPGLNDLPTMLLFATTANGRDTPDVGMHLDNANNVRIYNHLSVGDESQISDSATIRAYDQYNANGNRYGLLSQTVVDNTTILTVSSKVATGITGTVTNRFRNAADFMVSESLKNSIFGIKGTAVNELNAGVHATAYHMAGSDSQSYNNCNGLVRYGRGASASVSNTSGGTIKEAACLGGSINNTGTGTIETGYGLQIGYSNSGGGSFNSAVGIDASYYGDSLTIDNKWGFRFTGESANFMAGVLVIGGTVPALTTADALAGAGPTILIQSTNGSTGDNAQGIVVAETVPTTVNYKYHSFKSAPVAATAATLAHLMHFSADSTLAGSSDVRAQYGLHIDAGMDGAAVNYGLMSDLAQAPVLTGVSLVRTLSSGVTGALTSITLTNGPIGGFPSRPTVTVVSPTGTGATVTPVMIGDTAPYTLTGFNIHSKNQGSGYAAGTTTIRLSVQGSAVPAITANVTTTGALTANNVTATLTVSGTVHSMRVGSIFRIASPDATFDGRFIVTQIVSPTQFKYTQAGSATSTTATVYQDTNWNIYAHGSASNFLYGNTLIGTYTEAAVETAGYTGSRTLLSNIRCQVSGHLLLDSAATGDKYSSGLLMTKWSSGVVGNSAVAAVNGEHLGFIGWSGSDTVGQIEAALIRCRVDGAPGVNDMPGRLEFLTTADGAATPTLRATIDSAGAFILAGSSAVKATGTTWSNPSDQRLKTDIATYTKGLSELMGIQVRTFKFNGELGLPTDATQVGVIAQEIQHVLPSAVSMFEAELSTGRTQVMKVDPSELIWLLTSSCQQLKQELDELRAEVERLKSN